ncbi:hypothetical protein ACOME3_006485 [Neoechinorhynchus agilis]
MSIDRIASRLIELSRAFKEKERWYEEAALKKIKENEETTVELRTQLKELAIRQQRVKLREMEVKHAMPTKDISIANRLIQLKKEERSLSGQLEELISTNTGLLEHLQRDLDILKMKNAQKSKNCSVKMDKLRGMTTSREQTILLQSQLALHKSRNVDLRRQLESLMNTSDQYKSMWLDAINDIARIKQNEMNEMRNVLSRQRVEIQCLKKQLKSAEPMPSTKQR